MTKIWTEAEITLDNLIIYLVDSGFSPVRIDDRTIRLRTESGIGFRIIIREDKGFIEYRTYLPLNRSYSQQEKADFAHRLNGEIFLPTFVLDDDEYLIISYVLPYQWGGLIAGQFIAIANRFGSLLEYVVSEWNNGGIIDFGPQPSADTNGEQPQPVGPSNLVH